MTATHKTASSSPKGLSGDVIVTLHTHYALRAVRGRNKNEGQGLQAIIGLFPFSAQMNLIYNAAAGGDPFATVALVQQEYRMKKVLTWLEQKMRWVAKHIALNDDQINLMRPHSSKPVTMHLNVSHYGFRFLDLVVVFDKLACDTLNAVHRSRIRTLDGHELLSQGAAKLRKLTGCASSYRYTGVTREDLGLKTQLAQTAVDTLLRTQFILANNFAGFDDIVQYYLAYDQVPEYGPVVKQDTQGVGQLGPPPDQADK